MPLFNLASSDLSCAQNPPLTENSDDQYVIPLIKMIMYQFNSFYIVHQYYAYTVPKELACLFHVRVT